MALISINIPCYNRKEMLKECIQSFIDQTFGDWEIIVVDDGSTEDLTDIVEMDSRVKYVSHGKVGLPRAYNLALENSTGKYIIPFGSDDIASDKTMLETLLQTMMEKWDYKVIYSDYIQRDSGGKERVKKMLDVNTLDEPYRAMLEKQLIPHPGSFWRIAFIPRYDESLESAVDWELFLQAMELGINFFHVSKPLFTYRVGHEREGTKERQAIACDKVLKRRGYTFDKKRRVGIPVYDKKKNLKIDGWMAERDLDWLYKTACTMNKIVEIGSWKGKSTFALLSSGSIVYAVDHFLGSKDPADKTNIQAKDNDIYKEFMDNVGHFNNLSVLKMDSMNAAECFVGHTIDMVFIDGGHTQEEVEQDIGLWLPRASRIICGHDWQKSSVKKAVKNTIGDVEVVQDIWFKWL